MEARTSYLSKALLAVVFAMGLCVAICFAPAQAQAQSADTGLAPAAQAGQIATQSSHTYTLGTTVSGKATESENQTYSFYVNAPGADVNLYFANSINSSDICYYRLEGAGRTYASGNEARGGNGTESNVYLPQGSYTMTVSSYYGYWNSSYGILTDTDYFTFKITKIKPTIKLASKSGSLKPDTEKGVQFVYNTSDDYAEKNIKITKNTRPKVASAKIDIGSGGAGTLTLTPKKMGVTKVKVKIAGGNTATYTVYVKKGFAVVAKGEKTTLPKPVGVKKITFKNKSKKVAKVTKKGKVTAKKQGRAKVTAKSGKITYTYIVVVTDFYKLARRTYQDMLEEVPNPEATKINYAYCGYDKTVYSGLKTPVVYIDMSYTNSSGGPSRVKIKAYYDDALDPQYQAVSSSSTLMKKKSLNKAKIKK